jgi:hypothetical protein
MNNMISATVFIALSATTAVAQGNFQLLVPFEEGLRVEFYGFDENREQVFSETSPTRTLFDGNGYWVALIEEDLVFSGQFQIFCVRDLSGNWSVPEEVGKEAMGLICDYKPTDIGRGTFIFTPNRQ